jgi:hypothetical protein
VLVTLAVLAQRPLAAQSQTPATLPGQGETAAQMAPPIAPSGSVARFVELRFFTNLTRITGDARDRSFLSDGNNNAVDLNYLEDFNFGTRRMEASSMLRYTDDRRYDPERNSVQRAYLRVNGPRSEYNFGDYLVSYSRFSYNQNLKGLHFIRTAPWGYGFRLLGNAGTFTDRYGSLFKDELPGKPFTRVVAGLRGEQRIGPEQTIGVNWSYGHDLEDSIPVDPITGREPFQPAANHVLSLDTRMYLAGMWNLEGELAYSRTNRDTRVSDENHHDYAFRIDNSFRTSVGTFDVFYTRILPFFLAVNARQVADLDDLLTRASIPVGRHVQLQGLYRRAANDLRDERPEPRTIFHAPEVRLSLRDLPNFGSAVMDIGYRERYQDQELLADRVTRTPFFELGVPIASGMLTFGYEHRDTDDRLNANNGAVANDAWVSLRNVFDVADWTFIPLLRYQHNRETFERVDSRNNTRNILAAVTLDAPRYMSFDFLFRQVGATLFQDRLLLNPQTLQPVLDAGGLQRFEVVGPSGFRRPALRVATTYKFMNNSDRFLTLSYERNNNRFAVSGQDFLERVVQATLTLRFRRQ